MRADVIDSLRNAASSNDPEALQAALSKAIELIETMGGQLQAFKNLAQSSFRKKSEKIAPGQLAFELIGYLSQKPQAPEAEPVEPATTQALQAQDSPVKPKRAKRRSAIKLLPVDKVVLDVAEENKRCPCGCQMSFMGYDVRRQIVHTPQKLRMLEEHLSKYACGSCKDAVISPAGTPKPIERGLASSSLLAHLATSKVLDATPIERTGRQLERHGINIAPSTLHSWFGRAGALCAPVAHNAKVCLLASDLISLDDTPLLVKFHRFANGDVQTLKGRLWLYISDIDQTAFCEYTPDWKGIHPRAILDGYTGNVQSDGYGGLVPLFGKPNGPVRVGCNDHARRKFVEAFKLGDKRVEKAIALYAALYAVEARAKTHGLASCDLLQMRQRESKPIWHELEAEVMRLQTLGDRKTPLHKALTYWVKQRHALSAFLGDSDVPISNAHVERLLRTVGLFRKNSLFVGDLEAGHRFAMLLTVILNCVLCGANPYDYLCDVLHQLAALAPGAPVDHLMPRAWLAAQQQAND